jgi:hypothetical protein
LYTKSPFKTPTSEKKRLATVSAWAEYHCIIIIITHAYTVSDKGGEQMKVT